ncbi:MAG: PadR family transcriptional regulator [Acidimicrobiales bacterium]
MAKSPELSPGEWAVLGLVGEGPTHGFAVAQILAPGGELGAVWSMARPAVYNAVNKLEALRLVHPVAAEPGTRGPTRTVISLTDAGRLALDDWLGLPVDHVRDVRSLLLLKLALLSRARSDPAPLLESQRAKLVRQVASLSKVRDGASGFERVVAQWRLSSSKATLEFLEAVKGSPDLQSRAGK